MADAQWWEPAHKGAHRSVGGAHTDGTPRHQPQIALNQLFGTFAPRRPRATAGLQPIPRMTFTCLVSLVVQSGTVHLQQAIAPGAKQDRKVHISHCPGTWVAPALLSRKRAPCAETSLNFLVLPARGPHHFSLQLLAGTSRIHVQILSPRLPPRPPPARSRLSNSPFCSPALQIPVARLDFPL